MKIVNLTVYVPDDLEVNDITVGRALGEAIMTDTLRYEEAQVTRDRETRLENLLREIVNELSPFTHEDSLLDISTRIRNELW
jgi:hypothetical protein